MLIKEEAADDSPYHTEEPAMKKTLYILLAILASALLIGSFPARNLWGSGVCDGMRIAGFLIAGAATFLRYRQK